MVAIDTWLWPSPPEPQLIESIAAEFDHARKRLELIGQCYLGPSAPSLPPAQVASKLASNVALLKSIEEQMRPAAQHLAALLDVIMTAERVYLEVVSLPKIQTLT
jgi:hypothetical protein